MEVKGLPKNLEAEEGVIASILVDPGCLEQVSEALRPQDFYDMRCRRCFEACLTVENVSQITVHEELKRRGHYGKEMDAGYLSLIISRLPTSLYVKNYAEITAKLAAYRRFISASTEIARIGFDAKEDAIDGYSKIRRIVDNLMPQTGGAGALAPKDLAELAMRVANEWKEQKATVDFGYCNLDAATGGMNGGDLIAVGARPSVGKSQILLEVALNNVRAGRCVLFASVEMSARQVIERQISMALGKSVLQLRHGELSKMDWRKIVDLSQELSEGRFHILAGRVTLEGLGARARTMRETEDLALVCFDHVQFIARKLGKRYGDNVRERVGYTTNYLKSLAEELQVPVLAASQLARGLEGREDHLPRLSDFKESGSIEEDADLALLLHRPEMGTDCREDQKGLMYVKIAKDRQNGRSDVLKLRWSPQLYRYAAPEEQEEMEL